MKQGDLLSEKQWEKILNELWGGVGGIGQPVSVSIFDPGPRQKADPVCARSYLWS